ncbi:uncharacterized protein [Phyllobates terribilis]|uniref:uncharacterized protein n=1 Tax=Phyllobates terribilis TaxID=111132 RepID=UPI003CCAE79D
MEEKSQKKTTAHNMGQTSAPQPPAPQIPAPQPPAPQTPAPQPPAPQPYKLDETLPEMDNSFLIYLRNSLKSTESKNKLKKESKRHKMGVSPQFKSETISQFCVVGQETSKVNGSSGKSSSSRREERARNKAAMDSDKSSPAQEMNDAKNTHQGSEHSESSGKVKKNKKKKQRTSQEIPSSAPKHISGGKTYRRSNGGEATKDQIDKVTSRHDDGICQRRRKHSESLHQSHMCTSSPMSSPTALPKIKRNTMPNGDRKTEAASGMSDNSQDLFITQKKFASSHGSSGDSPPLGQKQCSGIRDSLGSQNPPPRLYHLCLTGNSVDQSGTGSQDQVVLVENATQTDDNFSYLALRSLVKKVKVLPPCSEKALNLSLPTRIRAKRDAGSTRDEDIIIVESQSSHVDPNTSRKSLLQKADEGKFIQTLLNSNYFFKGKGEPGVEKPIMPILKIKKEWKKKSRKSSVHSKRRRSNQHEK